MTRAWLVRVLELELRRAEDAIDEAYWAFTRRRRSKPPVLAVPWAYTLRAEAQVKLRLLRRPENKCDCRKCLVAALEEIN